VYERRTAGINGAAPAVEQDLPREQQLEQEIAELRLVSKDCLWRSTKQIDVRSALKVAQVGSFGSRRMHSLIKTPAVTASASRRP